MQNSNIIIRGGFAPILQVPFRQETEKKGKELSEDGHVDFVEEIQSGGSIEIRAKCIPAMSVSKDMYNVNFLLDPESRIYLDGRCSCPAGDGGLCKHGAAVVFYVAQERSEGCTDSPQQWKAPSKKTLDRYRKGAEICKLYPNPKLVTPLQFAMESSIETLVSDLSKCGLTSSSLFKSFTAKASNLDQANSTSVLILDPQVKAFLSTPSDSISDVQSGIGVIMMSPLYKSNIDVTSDQVKEIFVLTTKQSLSKDWYHLRKNRISASSAHKISNARKTETALKYFFAEPFDNANLRYGREMEPIALTKYHDLTGNQVIKSGLIVKANQPWICATPDAIVKDKNGNVIILEIKCPSSCKDARINVPYIMNDSNTVAKSHPYYTQVQVQLYCANIDICHLFVFSSQDHKLIVIKRDEHFL